MSSALDGSNTSLNLFEEEGSLNDADNFAVKGTENGGNVIRSPPGRASSAGLTASPHGNESTPNRVRRTPNRSQSGPLYSRPNHEQVKRVNVALDAARVGQLTRLQESVVEASRDTYKHKNEVNDHEFSKRSGLAQGNLVRSNFFQVIHEAAAMGRIKGNKPVEIVTNEAATKAGNETRSDRDQSTSKGKMPIRKASLLVDSYMSAEKERKKEHLLSPEAQLERLDDLENSRSNLSLLSPVVPTWEKQKRKIKMNSSFQGNLSTGSLPAFSSEQMTDKKQLSVPLTPQEVRKQVSKEAVEEANQRQTRILQCQSIKVTSKCTCGYCVNPSPYQTQYYKHLSTMGAGRKEEAVHAAQQLALLDPPVNASPINTSKDNHGVEDADIDHSSQNENPDAEFPEDNFKDDVQGPDNPFDDDGSIWEEDDPIGEVVSLEAESENSVESDILHDSGSFGHASISGKVSLASGMPSLADLSYDEEAWDQATQTSSSVAKSHNGHGSLGSSHSENFDELEAEEIDALSPKLNSLRSARKSAFTSDSDHEDKEERQDDFAVGIFDTVPTTPRRFASMSDFSNEESLSSPKESPVPEDYNNHKITDDMTEDEKQDAKELARLLQLQGEGHPIDENRLYELQLFDWFKNGWALTDQELEDLEKFKQQRAQATEGRKRASKQEDASTQSRRSTSIHEDPLEYPNHPQELPEDKIKSGHFDITDDSNDSDDSFESEAIDKDGPRSNDDESNILSQFLKNQMDEMLLEDEEIISRGTFDGPDDEARPVSQKPMIGIDEKEDGALHSKNRDESNGDSIGSEADFFGTPENFNESFADAPEMWVTPREIQNERNGDGKVTLGDKDFTRENFEESSWPGETPPTGGVSSSHTASEGVDSVEESSKDSEDLRRQESEDLDELNELYDRRDAGEDIDENRLYELELFDRSRQGEDLTSSEKEDLVFFTKRRRRIEKQVKEFNAMCDAQDAGQPVDSDRMYFLELVVRDRLGESLTDTEIQDLEKFEATDQGNGSRPALQNSRTKQRDIISEYEMPLQGNKEHMRKSEGDKEIASDPNDDSSLSSREIDELNHLLDQHEEGKNVDKQRMRELDLFDRWKGGEELDQLDSFELQIYRKKRQTERAYRREFQQLLLEKENGEDVDEYRLTCLALFARQYIGQELTQTEFAQLEAFQRQERSLESALASRPESKEAMVKKVRSNAIMSATTSKSDDFNVQREGHSLPNETSLPASLVADADTPEHRASDEDSYGFSDSENIPEKEPSPIALKEEPKINLDDTSYHSNESRGSADDDSSLSDGELDELDELTEKMESGEQIDEGRLFELDLFSRWQEGEKLSNDEAERLDTFKRQRRVEREYRKEFQELLFEKEAGKDVDEDRLSCLELYARRHLGHDLTDAEHKCLEAFEDREKSARAEATSRAHDDAMVNKKSTPVNTDYLWEDLEAEAAEIKIEEDAIRRAEAERVRERALNPTENSNALSAEQQSDDSDDSGDHETSSETRRRIAAEARKKAEKRIAEENRKARELVASQQDHSDLDVYEEARRIAQEAHARTTEHLSISHSDSELSSDNEELEVVTDNGIQVEIRAARNHVGNKDTLSNIETDTEAIDPTDSQQESVKASVKKQEAEAKNSKQKLVSTLEEALRELKIAQEQRRDAELRAKNEEQKAMDFERKLQQSEEQRREAEEKIKATEERATTDRNAAVEEIQGKLEKVEEQRVQAEAQADIAKEKAIAADRRTELAEEQRKEAEAMAKAEQGRAAAFRKEAFEASKMKGEIEGKGGAIRKDGTSNYQSIFNPDFNSDKRRSKLRVAVRPSLSWRCNPFESFSDWRVEIRPMGSREVSEYRLHRNIVGFGPRKSGYFAKEFLKYQRHNRTIGSEAQPTDPDSAVSKLTLPVVEVKVWELVLDYMYLADGQTQPTLTAERACAVYKLAERLEMPTLQTMLAEFYRKNLTIANMGKFLPAANKMRADRLVFVAKARIGSMITDDPSLARLLKPKFLAELGAILEKHRFQVMEHVKRHRPDAFEALETTQSRRWSLAVYHCSGAKDNVLSPDAFNSLTSESFLPVVDGKVALSLLKLQVKIENDRQSSEHEYLHPYSKTVGGYSSFERRCTMGIINDWENFRMGFDTQANMMVELQGLPSHILADILLYAQTKTVPPSLMS